MRLRNYHHFYAGFINKETDAITYRYLGISIKNIFYIKILLIYFQLREKERTTYPKLIESWEEDFPKI